MLYIEAKKKKQEVEAPQVTPEERLNDFIEAAYKAYKKLIVSRSPLRSLRKKFGEELTKEVLAEWSAQAKTIPAVEEFLAVYDLSKKSHKSILNALAEAVFDIQKKDLPADVAAWEKIKNILSKAYIQAAQEEGKQPLYTYGWPEKLVKKFFPSSLALSVDPNGKIVARFEKFGNAKKKLETKTKAIHILLTKWNELADRVNTDLVSSDPVIRLKALVTSILMATGIRVGKGESKVRDEEGNVLTVKTFGATSLLPEHVDFIRDDYAVLKFPGKAATENIAELTDPAILSALQNQIAAVAELTDGPLFITPDGKVVSPKMVNGYIHSILGPDVSAHSFRALKATQELFDKLRNNREKLATAMHNLKEVAKEDMKDAIVDTIMAHLEESYAEVQKALSHTNMAVTIENYTEPNVLIYYLTKHNLDGGLEAVVGDGKGIKVRFDPMDFYRTVIKEYPNSSVTAAAETVSTMFYYGDDFVDYSIDEAITELET